MTDQLPPSLQRFENAYAVAVRAELAPAASELGPRPADRRSRRRLPRRPRLLAGGTLGLAGVGATLAVVLSAGGATAPAAFAVTTNHDGSLTVNLLNEGGLVGANRKLAAMGAHEGISIEMKPGAARGDAPVACTPSPAGSTRPGPPVSAVFDPSTVKTAASTGSNGTGDTAAAVYHLVACTVHSSNLAPSQIGQSHVSGTVTTINAG